MSELKNINDTFEGYQKLISFYEEHKSKSFDDIEIKLSQWFSANMSATLGVILDKIQNNFNQIVFVNIDENIRQILSKNEFLTYYGFSKISDKHQTTIKFLKLEATDGKYFSNYVKNELIGRVELPKMSNLVKEKIAQGIYEIFVNAQIHSESDNIYTCGQFFPRDNKIQFTIVDNGIGFKRKISDYFKKEITSIKAIEWAVIDKNTTKKDVSGGIGLALLKEFVEKNKGKMQIISYEGFYQFDFQQGEITEQFQGSFPGTIVNLEFKTNDNSSYILKSELTSKDIF